MCEHVGGPSSRQEEPSPLNRLATLGTSLCFSQDVLQEVVWMQWSPARVLPSTEGPRSAWRHLSSPSACIAPQSDLALMGGVGWCLPPWVLRLEQGCPRTTMPQWSPLKPLEISCESPVFQAGCAGSAGEVALAACSPGGPGQEVWRPPHGPACEQTHVFPVCMGWRPQHVYTDARCRWGK